MATLLGPFRRKCQSYRPAQHCCVSPASLPQSISFADVDRYPVSPKPSALGSGLHQALLLSPQAAAWQPRGGLSGAWHLFMPRFPEEGACSPKPAFKCVLFKVSSLEMSPELDEARRGRQEMNGPDQLTADVRAYPPIHTCDHFGNVTGSDTEAARMERFASHL